MAVLINREVCVFLTTHSASKAGPHSRCHHPSTGARSIASRLSSQGNGIPPATSTGQCGGSINLSIAYNRVVVFKAVQSGARRVGHRIEPHQCGLRGEEGHETHGVALLGIRLAVTPSAASLCALAMALLAQSADDQPQQRASQGHGGHANYPTDGERRMKMIPHHLTQLNTRPKEDFSPSRRGRAQNRFHRAKEQINDTNGQGDHGTDASGFEQRRFHPPHPSKAPAGSVIEKKRSPIDATDGGAGDRQD